MSFLSYQMPLLVICFISVTFCSNFRGLHHIGFTVPNATEAVLFFEKVFDCTYIMSLGPFLPNDDWMGKHLNVANSASILNISFVRCGNGSNLEIFQYEIVNQSHTPAKNSDYDGHHLAFYVDNMTEALKSIEKFQIAENISIMSGPSINQDSSSGGLIWIYLTTKWGLQLELVSAPDGMAYEKKEDKRLWSPTNSFLMVEKQEEVMEKGSLIVIIVLAVSTLVLPIFGFLFGRRKGLESRLQERKLNESSL